MMPATTTTTTTITTYEIRPCLMCYADTERNAETAECRTCVELVKSSGVTPN